MSKTVILHAVSRYCFLFSIVLLPLTSEAAISSALTAATIQGNSPYVSFDNGITKAADLTPLLTLKLSDGTLLTKENNYTSANNPIELPELGQTLADVEMLLPLAHNSIDINTILNQNSYLYDDDGDSEFNTIGTLNLNVTDTKGESIKDRYAILDSCKAPYKVTLSSSASKLSSAYGDPQSTQYAAQSESFYIKPKKGNAIATYALPNLAYSGSFPNGSYNVDGPASEWSNQLGFRLQDVCNPSANFPTTGTAGVNFQLTISNPEGAVTYSKEPSSSGLDLTITNINSNSVKVMLTGPRKGADPATADTAVPTTFTIRSGFTPIYTFKIDKWFIMGPANTNGYDNNKCSSAFGSNYHNVRIVELTNANGSGWSGGLAGQGTNYQRRIGGGLLGEWGQFIWTTNYQTDFNYQTYWTSDKVDDNSQFTVNFYQGRVEYYNITQTFPQYICVK
ncbi:hypothetical protein PT276_08845 [Orbaceae bacterium ESL0721]|nr:hypothetical protein [Orbaceae bacterium ESL0721]